MKKMINKMVPAFTGVLIIGICLSSCYKKFDPATYAPALSIGGYTSSGEIAPANLVGYWGFDDNLLDSVTNTAGTNAGTTFQNGVKGKALLTGDKGYVLFNPGAAITGMKSFTIAYWVHAPVNAAGIAGTVNFSNNSNFWGNLDMFFENGSTADAAKFRVHVVNNGGSPEHWLAKDGVPGIFGNWVHFAVSYDGTSTFKFYVNGSLIVTDVDTNFGTLNFTNGGPLVFGTVQFMTDPSLTSSHGAEPWASYLKGGLDEVRIYNTALIDTDVNALVKLEGRGK
ncbi:MAG TPA: LamG domain-containing protein [Panacibacter sp.]|nr:LamG domain-containing protein [Panacibacter sp.]